MALARQNIPFVLTKGIDNKTSDKLYQGQLKQAVNIRMLKNGIIEKRFGVQALGSQDSAGNTVDNFEKLGSFNDELLAYAEGDTYSYATGVSKWFNKGGRKAVSVTRENTLRNPYAQTVPDIDSVNNTTLVAWEDARGGVRASVIDNASGQSFINDSVIDGTGTRPRCLAVGNSLVIFWVDNSNVLKMAEVNSLNPSTFGSPVTIGTCNATGFYDVRQRNATTAAVVHSTAAGTDLRFAYVLSDSLRVATSLDGLPNPVTKPALNPTHALNVFVDTVGNVVAFYYNSSNGVYYQAVTNIFATLLTETQINASVATDVNGGFAVFEKTTGNFTVIYDRAATNTNDHRIVNAVVTIGGSVTTGETVVIRSLGLISKAFNSDYFIAGYKSTNELQDTYFVLDTLGKVISRFSANIAGGHLSKSGQNVNVATLSSTEFVTSTQIKTRFVKDEGTFSTVNGVDRVFFDFSTSGVFYQQLGDNSHISGGVIGNYDGKEITEHGFNVYPENIQLVESTGGALTTLGTYLYLFIYQYEDSQGRRHQSTPSLPTSITLTGSNNRVTHTIPTLRVTDKQNVTVEIYRTQSGLSLFYKLTSFSSPLFNDPTVDSVNYVDDASDASIADNELVYTTGNVLENNAPPGAKAITVFQNRLWLAGLEEDDKAWFSKELTDGNGVAFSEFLQVNIDPIGGRVNAVKPLDDKLIFFKNTNLFVLTGNGPNAIGQGGSYNLQLITSDVGTMDANTIVSMELGLMFKSQKGIYLLDRGLNVNYIGAPVEDFNNFNMTSAVLIEDANEVRFTHSDAQTVVFNYYFNQWYTFDNYESRSAINLNSVYYKINEDDRVVENEVKDYYGDRLKPIIRTIETGWFSFGGINGFKRVYEIQTVGNYKDALSAVVSIAYDFKESYRESFFWTPETNLLYGEESPYGSEIYGGGSGDNVFYYRFLPAIQKCTSIRVRIQDSSPNSDLTKGFELNGFSFRVGVKPTTRKPNSGLTIAST
jgi:hypothetical protein